jgi:hypothetical protein
MEMQPLLTEEEAEADVITLHHLVVLAVLVVQVIVEFHIGLKENK